MCINIFLKNLCDDKFKKINNEVKSASHNFFKDVLITIK